MRLQVSIYLSNKNKIPNMRRKSDIALDLQVVTASYYKPLITTQKISTLYKIE
jgi:hypothetical protein